MTLTTQERALQKKRVLILYEDAGAGHKRVAEIAAGLFPETTHEVSLRSGSSFFNDSAATYVVWLWNTLIRWNWIRTADLLVNGFLRSCVFPIIETLITGHHKTIAEEEPDIIVSTADAWNKLLGSYCEQQCIPFIIIHTEVSVYQDLLHRHATHVCYFPESINAIQSYDFSGAYHSVVLSSGSSIWTKINYIRRMYVEHVWNCRSNSIYRKVDQPNRKMNNAKCVAIGPIVGDQFELPALSKDNGTQPCVLIMSGSIGGAFVVSIAQHLLKHWRGELRIIAVCGHDKRGQRILRRAGSENTGIDLQVHGFVEDMFQLYQTADVTIARPSSGVVFEALACGSRLLMPDLVTSNDSGNVDIIVQRGWGATFEGLAAIPEKVLTQLKYERVSSIDPEETRMALARVLLGEQEHVQRSYPSGI